MNDTPLPGLAGPGELARMNRLATIARLLAGLAHELNNSLQVVGGLVELLATRTDLPSDAVARLEKVSGQTDKATSAIRRVVGYSRERPAELALVDLASVVDQALALRQYQLGRLGVAAMVDRGPNGAYRVRADERQLTQAVLNLVLNAAEAMPSGGQLRLVLSRRGEMAEITVGDTGKGIPLENRQKIFQLFFTTRPGGSGIGLASTFRIVQLHNGSIDFTSEVGRGTTFRIELPLAA